mmetsp:Transcript_47664/g.58602  ORF Transcript_47664/g.58602 Transcript_47664/m.58602 type:complete len:168 (-) Transcript_47664:146-649(-)
MVTSMSESSIKSESVDIFRDTKVRYLGYANEVGESFRPLIPKYIVNGSYAVAFGYVFADSMDKMYKANQCDLSGINKYKCVLYNGMDSLIWQSFASVIIPGITINRIVKYTSYIPYIKKSHVYVQRSLPTMIGLLSIPVIIHPIDSFVHFIMNNTLRPYTIDLYTKD